MYIYNKSVMSVQLSSSFKNIKRYSVLSGHPSDFANDTELTCKIIGFGMTEDENNSGIKGYITTVQSKFGQNACAPHIGL